ncbi:MAG: Glutaconate CoA-transferase subunit A [Promethearchaeota archaeon]|jgi:glutaconate CoA-transferase subunit A|nr:MAG: Glutaconate CoA-transferase subunit A [Candidatus Lokiarchaeota archaeon]
MTQNKIMPLEEAISTYIDDGDLVGIGGLSFWRKPMSACREIIKQAKKDLTLCTFVGGIEIDMLVGAGCVSEVKASFVGMEVFGMAPNYRKAVEENTIKISEETEATIALGLRCSYLKVPFMPLRGIIGTDFPKVRDDIKQFRDPLGSGTQLMALPKIDLDVAIIHLPYADENGNGNIPGAVWMDADMAKTAKKTIITCEKIVELEDIIHMPGKAQLPMQTTTSVSRVPYGAHPTSCFPIYTFDAHHIQHYIEMEFEEYKNDYIANKNQVQYLEAAGGVERIFNVLL